MSDTCSIAKRKEACKSIILKTITYYTCIWNQSSCIKIKAKTCSDFNELLHPYYCEKMYLENPNKTCLYVNDECKEVYKECSLYTGTDPNECEVILPNDYNKKCVFKNNTCLEELKTSCSDYNNSYYEPRECHNIKLADTNKYCFLFNDSCLEQYKRCEYYKGNNETECERIIPSENNSICLFINNKCIQKEKTYCSQYKPGENYYKCSMIKLNDTDKHCVLVNNQCQEHYKYCWKIKQNKRYSFILDQCSEPEIHCP